MNPRVRTFEGSSPFWPAVPLPTRRPESEATLTGRRRAVLAVVEERAHSHIRALAGDPEGFLAASSQLGLSASDRLELARRALLADAAGFLPRVEWDGAEERPEAEVTLLDGLVLLPERLLGDPDSAVRAVLNSYGRYLRTLVRSAAYLGPPLSLTSSITLPPTPRPASDAGEAVVRSVEHLGRSVVEGLDALRRDVSTGVDGFHRARSEGRRLEAVGHGLGGWLRGLADLAGGVFGGCGGFLVGVLSAPTYLLGDVGDRLREGGLRPVAVGLDRALRSAARVVPSFFDRFIRGGLGVLSGLLTLPRHPQEGATKAGRGVVDALVQAPIDTLHELVGSVFSALLVILRLEPPGRALSPEEKLRFRRIYGPSLDLERVRVIEALAGMGALGDGGAFTLGSTIYLAGREPDEALGPTMHRVWRHQNGGVDSASARRLVRALATSRAPILWSRLPATRFEALSAAEQATLLMLAERSGFFESAGRAACLLLPRPGGAPMDLTTYMIEAWGLLKRGLGAR